jgi:hypothetical protein
VRDLQYRSARRKLTRQSQEKKLLGEHRWQQ